jgi:hypothetical protein
MKLIDIEKLEYEPFMMESGETVDYISAEAIRKTPVIDPVNHAEWVMTTRDMITDPGKLLINHNCSHCGQLEHVDIVPVVWWEAGYKEEYKPKLSNYCRDCGYRMDLRDLYEQYKRDWCAARGCVLEDTDKLTSVNGEIYACFTEWYNNEYLESRGE